MYTHVPSFHVIIGVIGLSLLALLREHRMTNSELQARVQGLQQFLNQVIKFYSMERVPILREFFELPDIPAVGPRAQNLMKARRTSDGFVARNSLMNRVSSISRTSSRSSPMRPGHEASFLSPHSTPTLIQGHDDDNLPDYPPRSS